MERIVELGNTKSSRLWTQNTWTALVKEQKAVRKPLVISNTLTQDNTKTVALSAFNFSSLNFTDKENGVESSAFPYTMILTDQRGFMFHIDFERNRFSQMARCGVSGSYLTFNPRKKKEVMVALSNKSLQCYSTETGLLLAKLPNFHRSAPYYISYDPKRSMMLSTSQDEAILWDTETWERKRTLFGDVGLQQACFSGNGEFVIASFQDATILLWKASDFSIHWKIQISATNPAVTKKDENTYLSYPRSAYFAVSPDSELLVYGGYKSNIFVWNIKEKRLIHEIILPSLKGGLITDIQFVDEVKKFALLTSTGLVLFIDALLGTFIGQLQSSHTILSFKVSPDFKVIAIHHTKARHQLSLYRLEAFLGKDQELEDVIEPVPPTKSLSTEIPVEVIAKLRSRDNKQKVLVDMVLSQDKATFDRSALKGFLKKYGQYPDEHRPLIWRCLLRLPENIDSYNALMSKGRHVAWKKLRDSYPLKSESLFRSLERILSALTYWSPIFGDLNYLPAMVFPFIKVFKNDIFSSFETCMSVLVNYCQSWWDYFPNPPIEVLNGFNQMLHHFEPEIFEHFRKYVISSQIFAWIPLKSFFAESFTRNEWCICWDHVLSNHPSFLYCMLLAYLSQSRASLLMINKKDDFLTFFKNPLAVNVFKMIEQAYIFFKHLPTSFTLSPKYGFIHAFSSIPRGVYPVFKKYPEFVVNYKAQMREKIQKEEDEYMRQRKVVHEMAKLQDELQRDKKLWGMLDWTVDDVLDRWWETMQADHEALLTKKAAVHAQNAQDKTFSMKQVADARKAFIENQLQNTIQHITSVTKSMDANRRQFEADLKTEVLDRQLDRLQDEWKDRKDELMTARREIDVREKKRLERLLRNSNVIGMKRQELESDLRQMEFATQEIGSPCRP